MSNDTTTNNSMEQSSSWKANSHCSRYSPSLMKPEGSLPSSQEPSIEPYPAHTLQSVPLLTYLLTYLLHGVGHYLKSWWSLSLSKNILLSLWNPKVPHRVHKSPLLDPILSQLNPVRLIDSYLPKVHLNVILLPTPRPSQWSLAFGPPNQNSVNTSLLPHACHMSRPPHPPWFNYPNNIRWRYGLWSSSLCNFLHDRSSSRLGPNILLNTIFST
jgi:hypothetical protein